MGKKIFQPTFWGGVKLMMMSICPILSDIIPFGFVPSEVDKWFRELIHDLKEARLTAPLQQEDLFQMLLNSTDKYGINNWQLITMSKNKFRSFFIYK